MGRTGSFICTKVAGKLKVYDREGMDALIAEYGDGEDLQFTIDEAGRKRTHAQNRFFHGPILKAFEPLGYRKQEAKDMLCLRFIPQEVRQLDGTIALVPGHTSALKVGEFNDLIESCIQLAAEQDCYIQDADEWRRDRLRDAHAIPDLPEPSARDLQAALTRINRVVEAGR